MAPAAVSVPKGVAGSVAVTLTGLSGAGADDVSAPFADAVVEALLRGPSFPARRLVGRVNEPLLFPPLHLAGDYELNDIKLVDAVTGETLMEATPDRVPIRVFDEVLISRVTSRPLTLDEIQERGIVIDADNFKALEFEVGFVLDGARIPIKFPVVAPTFTDSTEIIPQAELEARLAEAEAINREIASELDLPAELDGSRLNFQIQGFNFQPVDVSGTDLRLRIPPIPALVVIPGNVGFLNQFFSVRIFTENGAPEGSDLSVVNVLAEMVLPPGPDRVSASEYSEPGDDPLRFARVGADAVIEPVQPIRRAGLDGELGTADDIGRLEPGESGQGEFLVEGLQEGLHVMDIQLTATLEGLAAGPVEIMGKAAGSVLVRNPRFSLAFSHPRTIRAGEPYTANVTILNTSPSVANLVRVTLRDNSISGGELLSAETVELGNLGPGESANATYQVRALRTGAISFSNLTTSDDSLVGRFRLSMAVDERGVALSPDTLVMPEYVDELPEDVVFDATWVLGQALSVQTAGQLPGGVTSVHKSTITSRVLELAEAGQRLRYGDTPDRVLVDLFLDWQGARTFGPGFDQILRETRAGASFRARVFEALEGIDETDAVSRLVEHGPDLAGRGEAWWIAAANQASVDIAGYREGNEAGLESSAVRRVSGAPGARGGWLAAPVDAGVAEILWTTSAAVSDLELALWSSNGDGTGALLRWTISDAPEGARFRFDPFDPESGLAIDRDGDGAYEGSERGVVNVVEEAPPRIISVIQDLTVLAGRPRNRCLVGHLGNYAAVVAALFSKPMAQAAVDMPGAYVLDNGVTAGSVQIQPGGRVALLHMKAPLGAIRPRTLTARGLTDARGNAVEASAISVQTDFTDGVALRGRVVRGDGSPAAAVPVTLTVYDELKNDLFGCEPFVVRPAQVFADESGYFEFDMVLAGIPYSVSATDTGGLGPDAIDLILESASEDRIKRGKLLELASQPGVQNTLLAAFAVGALPQAIAAAEGLDRALLKDLVEPGSPRLGTEVPIALRFRGRGTVAGLVLDADGQTPARGVAVNLFPDPDSRELGRGLITDANGRFAFAGVPLGIFSVEATSPAGFSRTEAGILSIPGELREITVVLSSAVVPRTGMIGRVVENDGVTPHPRATVYFGRYGDSGFGSVVAATTSDSAGYWNVDNLPVQSYDVVAVSLDGKRRGERRNVGAVAGDITSATIALQGRATVSGRVETSTGVPVPNALVAGGEGIVRTDENGFFVMPGVPTGRRTLSAGVERNPAAGFDFPRTGGAVVHVLPGVANHAVIRLNSVGRIVGRVLDAAGDPVPNVNVAMPEGNGFRWVPADSEGNFRFENLALDRYKISAPAPPILDTNVAPLIDQIREGSQDDILAAIGEAYAIFTGEADPFLNGEGANFNPITWGFVEVELKFDGQTVVADIRYLREGTVSGVVLNGQGVPIGARVRLTGTGPLADGSPGFIVRGERNSDPATGVFTFPNQLLAGPWGLQAASPFFSEIITDSGQTSSIDPDAVDIVLQFPPIRETAGRLAGRILNPDGSPAGEGVAVHINFSDDYVIRTDEEGFFDTQIKLPAFDELRRPRGYRVEAADPVGGLRGVGTIVLAPIDVNFLEVTLLGRGDVEVTVLQANGDPVAGAMVDLTQGGFPGDRFDGETDETGFVRFPGVFAGPYSVCAEWVAGTSRIFGRSGVRVQRGETSAVTVMLEPTGSIRGTFVERDFVTPVGFAQIQVGNLGFATTDETGAFEVEGLPLGTFRLTSQNPVTGRGARLQATVSFEGEIKTVQMVEQALGEIAGAVIDSHRSGYVPGARVTWTQRDGGITPSRTVSAGPDGRFSFPGSPAGAFALEAEHPVTGLIGRRTGVLGEDMERFEINIPLQALAAMRVTVLRPDGSTPEDNATVTVMGTGLPETSADTDADGRIALTDLPLGSYSVRAAAMGLDVSRSAARTTVTLGEAGGVVEVSLILPGVGSVSGSVLSSDEVTPAVGAQVELFMDGPLFASERESAIADAGGAFQFQNLPIGPYRLVARSQALGASFNGTITENGQADEATLVLSASGSVTGILTRADGVAPVQGADVLLQFPSRSGLPGRAVVRSGVDGRFQVNQVPVGEFFLESIGLAFGGIVRFSGAVIENDDLVDLGRLPFDEDDPRVIRVSPEHTAVDVPITTGVDLEFNEPLDRDSLDPNGVFLRSDEAGVSATLDLLPNEGGDPDRLIRITPDEPLLSEVTYEVVVLDGERVNAVGAMIGSGPMDRVGRPLAAPFIASFTTADNDPPDLVSAFPVDGAVQIDPRAVPRLTFNEPIRGDGIEFDLVGPEGPVEGTANVGVRNLVLTFTPTFNLDPNAAYAMTIGGIRDLAGNPGLNLPLVVGFRTLDTLGPVISALRIVDDRLPIAGTVIEVEAEVQPGEDEVSVRFTRDFEFLSVSNESPFRGSLVLPEDGSATIRATAQDRYGNVGPLAELRIAVVENQPPQLSFTRVIPPNGPVPTGTFFVLDVIATDDSAVVELRAIAAGAVSSELTGESGDRLRLQGRVAETVGPGESIEIFAEAIDDAGVSSGEERLSLAISDGTKPTVEVVMPEPFTDVEPGGSISVIAVARDNFGIARLTAETDAPVSAAESVNAAPDSREELFAFALTVPANAPADGTPFQLRIRAEDSAGLVSDPIVVPLRMVDRKAPAVVSVNPPDEAEGVGLDPLIEIAFDEPVAAESVNDASIVLRSGADGEVVPLNLELSDDSSRVLATPISALTVAVRYDLTVTADVTDTAGNPLAPEFRSSFVTGDFRFTAPNAGDNFVELESVVLEAVSTSGTVDGVRFLANGVPVDADYEAPFAVQSTLPPVTDIGSNTLDLEAHAIQLIPADALTARAGPNERSASSGNAPAMAVDGDLTTFTWSTAPFNSVSPSYLGVTFGEPRPLTGIRLYKDANGGGGPNRKDLTIQYTTDETPVIDSGTWMPVPNLRSGTPEGLEMLDAESVHTDGTVVGDVHDSRTLGFATLRFDRVEATGVRVVFASDGLVHYRVYEFQTVGDNANSGERIVATADVQVGVFGRDDDTDEDGWLNGFEADRGMDPFLANADADDFDGDGLSNGMEKVYGTDPANADSDEDGLSDGDEVNLAGTEPLNPDTDGDMVPDGIDSDPLVAESLAPTIEVADRFEVAEGAFLRIDVIARDANGDLQQLLARVASGAGALNGLIAEFRNLTFTPGAMEQIDFGVEPDWVTRLPQIAFPNTTGPPWPGSPVRSDRVASRFTGSLLAPAAGEYTFFLRSDDGSDLKLDGGFVVGRPNGLGEATVTVPLAAGAHAFELRHFNGGNPGQLTLAWMGPDFEREVVPSEVLASLSVLRFVESGTYELRFDPGTGEIVTALELIAEVPGEYGIELVAVDAERLRTVERLDVTVLPDLDRDGIPDRDDPDVDGDGLDNDAELALGSDPRVADTDDDSVSDGSDHDPLTPNLPPVAGTAVSRASSLAFDGVDDFVRADEAALAIRRSLTVSAWFRNTDDFLEEEVNGGPGSNYLISKGVTSNTPWNDFYMNMGPERRLAFHVINAEQNAFTVRSEPLSDDWHHVAGVYDFDRSRLILYIDGARVAETDANGQIRSATNSILIGDWNGNSVWHFWHGDVDEVRVWDRARSQAEIRSDMFRRLTGLEPGLSAYWHFDEGSGDTAFDHTSNRADGLLGNGEINSSPGWVESGQAFVEDPVIHAVQDGSVTVELGGLDAEGHALSAVVVSLPIQGRLYQTTDGSTPGQEITELPAPVSDTEQRLIYQPDADSFGVDSFEYRVDNGAELSGVAAVQLHVQPLSAAPDAQADSAVTYQDTPLLLDDLLENDQDPDGDTIELVTFTQPTNGTLVRTDNGDLLYTPDTGFFGDDTFTYSIADAVRWDRSADFTPPPATGSMAGNPDNDGMGFPVWTLDYVRGEGLAAGAPWFRQRGARLVWDAAWFGGAGLWARDDDLSPIIDPTGTTHTIISEEIREHIPVVRWVNPFGPFIVDVLGELGIAWSGSNGVGGETDVDVVIAHLDVSEDRFTTLLETTVSKPTPGESVGDTVIVPVQLRDLSVNLGDELIVTHRAQNLLNNRWINLSDDLVIVPSAPSRTATVTVDVQPNATPLVSTPIPGSALEFDGANDFVNLGSPPELQITGDQTIEFWIQPFRLGGRMNPFAKAYAGEGTMTIEPNGSINYFYGNLGRDGGSGEVNYTSINTRVSLPVLWWTHVALVRDLQAGKLRWFFNGSLVNETEALFDEAVAGDQPAYLGRGYVDHFAGRMDEFRIWNVARTAEQIQEGLYARMDGDAPGLVVYFDFDEGSGTTTRNRSPIDLPGTLGSDDDNRPVWVDSFAPFDNAVLATEDTGLPLTLEGSDADGDTLTAVVINLPDRGFLFQTDDGVVPTVPVTVSAPDFALQFDGSGDYVDLGNPVELQITGDQTIEFWVRVDSLGSRQNPFGKAYSGEGTFTIEQNGLVNYFYGILGTNSGADGVAYQAIDSAIALEAGRWTHMAVVRDFQSGELRWYVNGEETNSEPVIFSQATAGDLTAYLARGYAGLLTGALDEVRVWNVARTAAQIRNVMDQSLVGDEAGLAAYWRFGEGGGDWIVSGAPGRLSGMLEGDTAWIESDAPIRTAGSLAITHPDRITIYQPDPNYHGIDFFRYAVNDGKVTSTEGRIPVRIVPVNDAPFAADDSVSAVAGFTAVTANLWDNDHDVEGDSFELDSFTQASHGVVEFLGDGIFSYTPEFGFTGEDAFTYRLTDGDAVGEPGLVQISVASADAFRWINADGGQWGQATNWSQGVVPGDRDIVVIDLEGDYTVTVNVDSEVERLYFGASTGNQSLRLNGRTLSIRQHSELGQQATFDFSNGTLRGDGNLTIRGRLNWAAGTMEGSGVVELLEGSEATLDGAGVKALKDGRRIVNRSTLAIREGQLALQNPERGGAGLENHGRMEFDVGADVIWNNSSSDRPVALVNEGTVVKIGDGTTTVIGVPFTNRGLVEVNEGSLTFGAGWTHEATMTTAPGTSVRIQGGEVSVVAGAEWSGQGTVTFEDGSGTIAAPLDIAETVTVSGGGPWVFEVDQLFPSLVVTGGIIDGPGTVTIAEVFEWTRGTIQGPGTIEVALGAEATLRTNGDKRLQDGRRLINRGSATFQEGPLYLDNRNARGATVENLGRLELLGESADILWFNFALDRVVSVINSGTLIKTGPGTEAEISVPVTNRGVIEIREGSMVLAHGLTQDGTLTTSAGSSLRFKGGAYSFSESARVTSEGDLILERGAGALPAELQITGPLTILGGGPWDFVGDQVFPSLTMSEGTVGGPGNLTVTDFFEWSGGIIQGEATLELVEGVEANIDGANNKQLIDGRRLLNRTTLTIRGRGLILSNGNTGGATLENAGTLELPDDADIEWVNLDFSRPVAWINDGTFIKTGEGTLTVISVPLTQNGNIEVRSGQLQLSARSSSSGTVDIQGGQMQINASSTFTGTVAIGTDGELRFQGGNHEWLDPLQWTGDGALVVNRPVTLGADAAFGALKVTFGGASTISGAFLVSNSSPGEIHVARNIDFPGDVTVAGLLAIPDSSLRVTVDGTLTLADTGTLDNLGRLDVGAFVDEGGTLIGNPPGEVGLPQGSTLTISSIRMVRETPTGDPAVAKARDGTRRIEIALEWKHEPNVSFTVLASRDLTHWIRVDAAVVEREPGLYQALVRPDDSALQFFRLRVVSNP